MSRSPHTPARRGRVFLIAAAAAGVLGVAAAVWFLKTRRPGVEAGSWNGANVVFITVDTLRADKLGAYGFGGVRTPVIDGLARRGVLFEQAMTAAPITLPSHTTLFSGTYPLRHGVRDNGGYYVPEELPTLPQLFHGRGYATAAFVGAFVLDSRWGLNRGFDTYYDHFDTRKAALVSIGDIERPAGEVVDAAVRWLGQRETKKPFFLWLHLYDPHAPYAPPAPYAQEYEGRPYLGEIAYVDAELGRLFGYLEGQGLADQTAIVFAADHGEALGEHEEDGHGFFIYQEALHVPLILVPPGGTRAARRPEVVSLADVAPTISELAGVGMMPGMQGRSLLPLLSGGAWEPRPVYSETQYPRIHFGWSPLSSIQTADWKLIESSDPELYQLSRDPEEATNLAAADREKYLELRRRYASLVEAWGRDPLSARARTDDPEAARKLASLGYLTGSVDDGVDTSAAPSPRSKIRLYATLNAARSITDREELPRAEKMLREVLAQDPGVVDARVALANVLLREKRLTEAIPLLEEAARRRTSDPTLIVTLALTQLQAGRPADAETLVRRAINGGEDDPRLPFFLGTLAEARGERARADEWFARSIEAEPASASARSALAELLLNRGDAAGAGREAREAIRLDKAVRGAHFILGRLLEREGKDAEAFDEYGLELSVNAEDERVFLAFTELSKRLGRAADEAAILEKAVAAQPDRALGYLFLARNFLDREVALDRALTLARSGLDRAAGDRQAAFGCFLLADLYNRVGDPARSAEYAERGRGYARRAG